MREVNMSSSRLYIYFSACVCIVSRICKSSRSVLYSSDVVSSQIRCGRKTREVLSYRLLAML